MDRRKIRSAGEARQCLAAAAASGLSRVQWAHQHGEDARSLNAWRMTLDRTGAVGGPRLLELVASQPVSRPSAIYKVRVGAFKVEAHGGFD